MSSNLSFLFFVVLVSLKAAFAVQEITIYSRRDQEGSSITFRDKIPDLSNWDFFMDTSASYCVTGIWTFFATLNYDGGYGTYFSNPGETNGFDVERCENVGISYFSAVRYWGPQDTRTVALAFFEGSLFDVGGREQVITGAAETNLDFSTPRIIASFGNSNWTLFPEPNFQGNSTCFLSEGSTVKYYTNAASVGSVLRGCVETET